MRAFRITAQSDEHCDTQPLPLPALHREGHVPPELFRRQASGEVPRADQNLAPSRFVRSIVLDDGGVRNLASDNGALLTFVISGSLAIADGLEDLLTLEPGDLFLMDAAIAPRLTAVAKNGCRLIQAGVAADWPGAEAEILKSGTINPRATPEPNLKRVIKDDDDRAYFTEFPELFSAPANQWSAPRPNSGFRFMSWEGGFIDWHPEVINCLAIILAGELEIETGGRGGGVEVFRAGDVCLAEDRTGEGHIDRTRGLMQVALFVLADDYIW